MKSKSIRTRKADKSNFIPLQFVVKDNLLVALGLAIISFIVYSFTLSTVLLPGEAAEFLSTLVGSSPDFSPRHLIWKKIVSAVLFVFSGGTHITLVANIFSAFISSLTVGLMYLVTSMSINSFLHFGQLGSFLQMDTTDIERKISMVSGIFSSLILAFSAPFWFSATQVFANNFYLLWLLFSLFLYLRFVMSHNFKWLYAFCFIHCLGASQTSCFIAFAPFLYIGILYILFVSGNFKLNRFLPIVLLSILGFSFFFVCCSAFYNSSAFELTNFETYFEVVKHMGRELVNGVTNNLPKEGWLIVIGSTVIPCVASLIVANRVLTGEQDFGFYFLHLAICIAVVIPIFDLAISPWQFFGQSNTYMVPYAMMAFTFGYLISYVIALGLSFFVYERSISNPCVQVALTSIVIGAIIVVTTIVRNSEDANNKKQSYISVYVDKLLDGVGDVKWIATNGVLDGVIKVRAKERGLNVDLLNFSYGSNQIMLKYLKTKMSSTRLKNTVEIGVFPLIQEWIASESDAKDFLALGLFPDLWNMGDYEAYPFGMLFRGCSSEELDKLDLMSEMKRYEASMQEIAEHLPDPIRYSEIETYKDFLAVYVRSQVSFIGNNLGFLLETRGDKESAYKMYTMVHSFDPNNISALLNYASLVQSGIHPEKKDEVLKELDEFHSRNDVRADIWSLSRTFGYVSSPEAFARLGWTWAMSGQSNVAIKSLTRALKSVNTENKSPIRNVIAQIYARNNDSNMSEEVYKSVLKEDPGDHQALMGLVRLNIMRGDLKQAQEYLMEAQKAGVAREKILFETAVIMITDEQYDRARIVCAELRDINPDNPDIYVIEIQLYSIIYGLANSDERVSEALDGIKKSIEQLVRVTGETSLQTLISQGLYYSLIKEFSKARDCYISSLKVAPNKVPVLENILRMDRELIDKESAKRHARDILHLDINNSFANYIMGSLALDQNQILEAEDFLARSVSTQETLFGLNDLAVAKFMLGKLDASEELIRKVFEIDDKFYAAWDTLGSIYFARKNYEEAENAYKTALGFYNGDLRVHLHLAKVYFATQRIDECREIMRRLSTGIDSFIGADLEEYDELSRQLLSIK